MEKVRSKLELSGDRVYVEAGQAKQTLITILQALGCTRDTTQAVAEHLVDTSLCGMESHGIMRILQYAQDFQSGLLDPQASAVFRKSDRGSYEVDGERGIGIPALALAYDKGMDLAQDSGISALALRNVGHTGRHGAFADSAAQAGFLTILIGGGFRQKWRQVAPYGGTKALLPTNPYCIAIPGGDRGPVVLDFATSKIAGGWIYAAKSAGALLPQGCVIDANGQPTRDPQDYFDGGAILPSGAQKGYAMALMAEMIGEALLGPVTTECHWLLVTLRCDHWRDPSQMQSMAEEVLAEIRDCPPAPGFDRVEVPGERERDHRESSNGKIAVPQATWEQILALESKLLSQAP